MKIEGHSVFGYFNDLDDAERAKKQLRAAGFDDTQLDFVGHDSGTDSATNPLAGNVTRLSHLTLGTGGDDDQGVIHAADPSASGLAGEGRGQEGKAWLVVTVTDGSDDDVERAVEIVQSCGGKV